VFLGGLAIFAFDVDFAHAPGEIAVTDAAVDFADDRGVLGFASLEEFDNARETAGDVLGLGGFGEDREGEGIPFGKNLAVGDVFTVLDAEARAVNDVVALLLAVLFIDDGDQSGAVHGDGSAATAFDELHVHELDNAVVARFERGALGDARGGSADVEGAHGQLRAGFADGLRGDDANRFAQFDHAAGGEVAPVAQRANAAA